MIRTSRAVVALLAVLFIASCGDTKFKSYDGPPVTQIQVNKGERTMYLISGKTVVKEYDVGLGWAPVGHKQFEGDGKTPEGLYFIDRFNPNSRYHLSVGISYPNSRDMAFAATQGRKAGSDIFIHGRGPEGNAATRRDWTAGCIAVDDKEIEEIFAMLPQTGVPVLIMP